MQERMRTKIPITTRIRWYALLCLLLFPAIGYSEPVKHHLPVSFKNYQGLFHYIAKHEFGREIPATDMLYDLAVESTVERYRLQLEPEVWGLVIKADLRDKYTQISLIRGAQDNGRFYVITPTHEGLELVGVLEGNGYTTEWTHGDKLRFITTWHLSAHESGRMTYEWNGREVTMISSE